MTIEKYRHPLAFYIWSTVIPWGFWFAAAYASHALPLQKTTSVIVGILSVLGLLGPLLVSLWLIWPDQVLREDIKKRLFGLNANNWLYLLLACLIMPLSILLAQAISLIAGYSVTQFYFSDLSSFSAGIFPGWFLLFLAPIIEELAWHTYGIDCLRRRMNLFITSMLFAFFWAVWHFPLAFIKDYYHSNMAESGVIYSANFVLSLFPYVILMNWLYYKSDRSVFVTIIFHVTAGFFNEIFCTHPDSKIIQTFLLVILSVIILFKDKKMFFTK